jgi:DNA-binding MarR family transcriptional regulator
VQPSPRGRNRPTLPAVSIAAGDGTAVRASGVAAADGTAVRASGITTADGAAGRTSGIAAGDGSAVRASGLPRVGAVVERDEVDHLIAAWRRERPDLDVEPMQVLSRVHRLAKHLDKARRAAFAAHGLEPWEFDVLAALRRAGRPYRLSPGQLLRETMVTSGTMTNRVDRLSARGLVARDQHPDDRRGVIVEITADGLATVDAAMTDLLVAERELLVALPAAEQQNLAAALRVLLRCQEEPAG